MQYMSRNRVRGIRKCIVCSAVAGVAVSLLLAAGLALRLAGGGDDSGGGAWHSDIDIMPFSVPLREEIRRADDAPLPGWVVRRTSEDLRSNDPAAVWKRVNDGLRRLCRSYTPNLTSTEETAYDRRDNEHNNNNNYKNNNNCKHADIAGAKNCLSKIAAAEQGPRIPAAAAASSSAAASAAHHAYDIVVGVMSARDNYEQRSALRSSWVGAANTAHDLKDRVLARFIVGETPCTIPPLDRENPLGCNPRYGTNSASRQASSPILDTAIFAHALPETAASAGKVLPPWGTVGSDFQLHRWISISHVGVYDFMLDGLKQHSVKVKVWDKDTKRVVAEGIFTPQQSGELRGCHRYLVLNPPLSLPAGFRGTLSISPHSPASATAILEPMLWFDQAASRNVANDGGGVVEFKPGARCGTSRDGFPELLQSALFDSGGDRDHDRADLLAASGRFASATFVYTSNTAPGAVQQGLQWQRGASYVDTAVELGLDDVLELKWGSGPGAAAAAVAAAGRSVHAAAAPPPPLPPSLSSSVTAVRLKDESSFAACDFGGHASVGVVTEATPTNTYTTQLLQGGVLAAGVHYISATDPTDCKRGMKFVLTVVDRVKESFELFDPAAIKSRRKRWALTLAAEAQAVRAEAEEHDDMVILPDHLDSYAGLPRKVLRFFQWSQQLQEYNYALKTDDDCFVDIRAVLAAYDQLKLGASASGGGGGGGGNNMNVWWSDFRTGWPVARSGKWKETEYTADAYPSFGCGSGSMISRPLVDWLGSNADHLHAGYQGEDTSIGIWLAALKPTLLRDPRWHCSRGCSKGMFASPQHTPAEIKAMWWRLAASGSACA